MKTQSCLNMTPFFTFNCFRKLPWIVYLFAFFIFLYNLDLGKGSFTYCQCCGEEGGGVGGKGQTFPHVISVLFCSFISPLQFGLIPSLLLPGKRTFHNLDKKFLEKRRIALDTYLQVRDQHSVEISVLLCL